MSDVVVITEGLCFRPRFDNLDEDSDRLRSNIIYLHHDDQLTIPRCLDHRPEGDARQDRPADP